jgi:gamma-glutamyl hydrolase
LKIESFLASSNLSNFYTVSSTATGSDNITAVASFEAKRYPFFGVQFHPEKNMYEWKFDSIPHTPQAIKVIIFLSTIN